MTSVLSLLVEEADGFLTESIGTNERSLVTLTALMDLVSTGRALLALGDGGPFASKQAEV